MTVPDHDLYCRELAELIARSESGDATPEDVDRIEAHLRDCPVCQGAESVLSSAISRWRNREAGEVSAGFEAEMIEQYCGGDKPGGTSQA